MMEETESFKLELVFGKETGEIVDVIPLGGEAPYPPTVDQTEPRPSHIPMQKLSEKVKKAVNHSLLFTWGSPGCVTFKTKTGYVTYCK